MNDQGGSRESTLTLHKMLAKFFQSYPKDSSVFGFVFSWGVARALPQAGMTPIKKHSAMDMAFQLVFYGPCRQRRFC